MSKGQFVDEWIVERVNREANKGLVRIKREVAPKLSDIENWSQTKEKSPCSLTSGMNKV